MKSPANQPAPPSGGHVAVLDGRGRGSADIDQEPVVPSPTGFVPHEHTLGRHHVSVPFIGDQELHVIFGARDVTTRPARRLPTQVN